MYEKILFLRLGHRCGGGKPKNFYRVHKFLRHSSVCRLQDILIVFPILQYFLALFPSLNIFLGSFSAIYDLRNGLSQAKWIKMCQNRLNKGNFSTIKETTKKLADFNSGKYFEMTKISTDFHSCRLFFVRPKKVKTR